MLVVTNGDRRGGDVGVKFSGSGLVMFIMGETGVLDPTDLHRVVLLEDGGVAGTGILESEHLGFDLHCCLIP